MLRAREEAFWTSTSEESSRWITGARTASDTGSVTAGECEGVVCVKSDLKEVNDQITS